MNKSLNEYVNRRKILFFWNLTPCNLVGGQADFRFPYYRQIPYTLSSTLNLKAAIFSQIL
jgi:hypothetical protein